MRTFAFTGIFAASLVLGLGGSSAEACVDIPSLIDEGLSAEPVSAAAARKLLRELGQAAVDSIGERLDALQKVLAAETSPRKRAELELQRSKLVELIDEVGAQKYCDYSRLYWHTDFSLAKQEAARTNRPILSLRMLGKLTDELSCANSRFFRVALYANADVSKLLREKYVLHWESIRPVPRVTVDFGDGRKLERTLTGNSIHYVLTPDGDVVDALPGLYAPQEFQKRLAALHSGAVGLGKVPAAVRTQALKDYHNRELVSLQRNWLALIQENPSAAPQDAGQQGGQQQGEQQQGGRQQVPQAGQAPQQAAAPKAVRAAKVAPSKSVVELKVIADITQVAADTDNATADDWARLSARRVLRLDSASRRLIRERHCLASPPGNDRTDATGSESARLDDANFEKLIDSFEQAMAIDTLRNEFVFHRTLHDWLRNAPSPQVNQLNERVYAELFLTPSSDPWLGLVSPDIYTAIPNAGVK